MKKVVPFLPFIIIGISTWLTLTGRWIVPSVNQWQADMMGDNKYFPALTIFILALPPLLILVGIKKWWQKRSS